MLPGSSSSTTPSDLLGLTRFLTGTLDNTAAFSDTNILAIVNVKYRAFQAELLAALNYDWGESTLDGSGGGSIALVASDNSYSFPTDMIQVDRIEINFTGVSNDYHEAEIVPLQGMQGGVNNITNNAAIMGSKTRPVVYIRNGVFYVDPVPDTAVTGGLKVYGKTLISDLTVGGTAPVFAAPFHEILAYDASQVWCAANEMATKANRLLQERDMIFRKAVGFYSTRNATMQPVMQAKYRSMR